MCGICGIVDFNGQILNKDKFTDLMKHKLTHRGPDDEGSYNDELVSIGFKRLSIIDVKNGNQPVLNKNKTIVSIFNGEIYNFKEIRNILEKKGYHFYSNSDSEIIPYAYEVWGIHFVEKLNGMFSIAIYDKRDKSFYLIRDRLGIKPLYYFKHKNSLIFSSEINSLISLPFFKKGVNFKAISSYLSFRYPTEDNETFFLGVKRLPAGQYLKINDKEQKFTSFWKVPHPGVEKEYSEKFYLEKLDYLLNKSVKGQLISDVPLGVFLSGGLDSSLLSAIASKNMNRNLDTYSVTLSEHGYDESEKAKIVSKYLNTNHHEVILEKSNFIENLNNLIKIKGVPASIPHEYALYLLSKEMKKKISVVLSGEGADEYFGGYSRVQKSPFDFFKYQFIKKFGLNFNRNNFESFYQFILSRYNWFSPVEKDRLLSNDFKLKTANDADLENNWKTILGKGTLSESYNKVLYMFQTKHLKCLLDRLDTMTMAASVEARVPFLDHEVVEFINSVPFEYKIKWKSQFHKIMSLFSSSSNFTEASDINKFLLRKLSKSYIPTKISNAKKLGFPIPLNDWVNNEQIKEILISKNSLSKEFYNTQELKKILEMREDKNFDFAGKKVWMLLNIELWMRQHFG